MNYVDELTVAGQLAREAGRLLLARSQRGALPSRVKNGDQREPVTDADLEADQLIRAGLGRAFPRDLILTEETAPDPSELATRNDPPASRRWVVDPLDGTTNFIAGVPFWGVSIALEDHGDCVLGVVFDPIRDETFQSERGHQATCNGSPIGVAANPLSGSVAAVLLNAEHRSRPEVRRLCDAVRATRELGATALELAWVASGRLDLCLFRRGDRPWDWLAGARLIEDAGGEVAAFGASIPKATLVGSPLALNEATASTRNHRPADTTRAIPDRETT